MCALPDMAGEVWVQWFSCCITRQPPGKRRQRIDRSMIGEPMNFRHTGHIGSGDVQLGSSHLQALQTQMQSKGGYEAALAASNAASVPLITVGNH